MRLADTLTLLNLTLFALTQTPLFTIATDYEHEFDDVLKKGILFNEESKILLAEKFVPVQFLVPFASYNFTLKPELVSMPDKLNHMWSLPSSHCPLDFASHFQSNHSSFNVNWMFHKIEHEVNQSKRDVSVIRNETATFLQTNANGQQESRVRRGAHVGALALAGIGLFGSGLMMGGSGNCGLSGIFGSCQDQVKTNAANIDHLGTITTILADHVTKMKTDTDQKFFLVGNKLKEVEEAQQQMVETLNQNWQLIEEQFNAISMNFHILRDCTQMLFSNQQVNFNFDTMASILSLLYSDVKSYRSAIYTNRMNVLNAIPSLLQQHLPMSLVPKESLLAILQSVGDELVLSGSRLSLAIPPNSDIMSYYDAKLLRDVVTVNEGLILTLAIPLASRQTVFSTYSARVVPMPLGIRHMAAHLCNRHIRNERVQPTGATQIVESTNSRLQNLYNYCCL